MVCGSPWSWDKSIGTLCLLFDSARSWTTLTVTVGVDKHLNYNLWLSLVDSSTLLNPAWFKISTHFFRLFSPASIHSRFQTYVAPRFRLSVYTHFPNLFYLYCTLLDGLCCSCPLDLSGISTEASFLSICSVRFFFFTTSQSSRRVHRFYLMRCSKAGLREYSWQHGAKPVHLEQCIESLQLTWSMPCVFILWPAT